MIVNVQRMRCVVCFVDNSVLLLHTAQTKTAAAYTEPHKSQHSILYSGGINVVMIYIYSHISYITEAWNGSGNTICYLFAIAEDLGII